MLCTCIFLNIYKHVKDKLYLDKKYIFKTVIYYNIFCLDLKSKPRASRNKTKAVRTSDVLQPNMFIDKLISLDCYRYFQCVTYGSLPTESHELAYFLVNMILMYVIPLMSTLYCSSAALLEIIRRANQSNGEY